MKVWKIVVFILGVLAGMASISAIFPAQGLRIGNMQLNWPNIYATLSIPHKDTTETNNSLKARINNLRITTEKDFHTFCTTSPARIYMPNDKQDYLDPFFTALDSARHHPLRILHYGDSQIECDRITSAIRQRLQQMFGGQGVGLIPLCQSIATYTLQQATTPSLQRYCVYGPSEMRIANQRYGVMGAMSRVDGRVYLNVSKSPTSKFANANLFRKVQAVVMGTGKVQVVANGETTELAPNNSHCDEMRIFCAHLPHDVSNAQIIIDGHMDVYGIMLDGLNGVSMDNIPMRGCAGTVFTRINSTSIAPFFKQQNVALVIMQYGGNAAPFLRNDQEIRNYCQNIRQQISTIRQWAADSKILFIGPADMATKINGRMQSYQNLKTVIETIKQAVNQEGAAFWDMYSAMGGEGSIIQWVKAQPPLAGKDYIHFTPIGAEKISDIFFNTMLSYYNFYHFRHHTKAIATSVQAQSDSDNRMHTP